MSILTLTTDLGTRDHYAAAVKAAAIAQIPNLQLVDITHDIPPFNINKAAFVLKHVWRDFPKGTIHLIGVDTQWSKASPWVVVSYEGHYFIGTDNGLFSLLLGSDSEATVHAIDTPGDVMPQFPSRDVFVPAAAAIAAGQPLTAIGPQRESYRVRPGIAPVVGYDNIRGAVIYVDSYGNVITNISKQLFDEVLGDRSFQLVLKRGDRDIQHISRVYGEVQEGEKLAIFTSGGLLEIAINRGIEGSGGQKLNPC